MSWSRTVLGPLLLVIVALVAVAAGATAGERAPRASLTYVGMTGGATIAAGAREPVRLYAEETGSGRPILLIHGLGASTYTWRNVVPELARRGRVIAVDLKGFGRSDKPFDLAYSPADHARTIVEFIRRRGLDDVTLVGHSFGGAIALLVTLELNRSAPGRVRDLVLIDAPAYRQPSTNFVDLMRMPVLPYALLTLVPPELATWLALDEDQARLMSPRDVLSYAAPFRDAGARHALIATTRQIEPPDFASITAAYATIPQRTLIIWCRDDPTVPLATGQKLARTLKRARLEVLEGCTHVPQDERPDAVNRLLRGFVR
ncbi:MAG: alpha/beta fold hydrolase [Hyphomicrobiaceae bacterium]|nr:alpha/beta fold hydrolase [Hyphomicrobiaceae bacterium]